MMVARYAEMLGVPVGEAAGNAAEAARNAAEAARDPAGESPPEE